MLKVDRHNYVKVGQRAEDASAEMCGNCGAPTFHVVAEGQSCGGARGRSTLTGVGSWSQRPCVAAVAWQEGARQQRARGRHAVCENAITLPKG